MARSKLPPVTWGRFILWSLWAAMVMVFVWLLANNVIPLANVFVLFLTFSFIGFTQPVLIREPSKWALIKSFSVPALIFMVLFVAGVSAFAIWHPVVAELWLDSFGTKLLANPVILTLYWIFGVAYQWLRVRDRLVGRPFTA